MSRGRLGLALKFVTPVVSHSTAKIYEWLGCASIATIWLCERRSIRLGMGRRSMLHAKQKRRVAWLPPSSLSSHLKKKCITTSTSPKIALTRPKITVTKRILSRFIWKVLSKALPKSSTPPHIVSGRGTLGDVCACVLKFEVERRKIEWVCRRWVGRKKEVGRRVGRVGSRVGIWMPAPRVRL